MGSKSVVRAIFRRQSVQPGSPEMSPPAIEGEDLEFDAFEKALQLFLQNEFASSLAICSDREKRSIYHALGKSVLCFINAIVTKHEPEQISSREALQGLMNFCEERRSKSPTNRRGSIFNLLPIGRTASYEELSDTEIHTELILAQANLMMAVLYIIKEKDVNSIQKRICSHIKNCTQTFKQCLDALTSKKTWISEESKSNFKSGLYTAIALHNFTLAMLPSSIQKYLQDMGCAGDISIGMSFLEKASEINGIYKILAYILLGYCEILCPDDAQYLIPEKLFVDFYESNNKSVFLTFLMAGIKLTRKQLKQATDLLKEVLIGQDEWVELANAAVTNLMWSNALLLDWDKSLYYANKLLQSNSWYPELHQYQITAFNHIKHFLADTHQDKEIQQQFTNSLESVKSLKKFADQLTLSENIILNEVMGVTEDSKQLVLPAIELLYHMDYLKYAPIEKLIHMLEIVDKRFNQILVDQGLSAEIDDEIGPCLDDYATLKLLKAKCCRYIGQILNANHALKEIIERKHRLSPKKSYLVALAMMELAFMAASKDQSKNLEAQFWLKTVKDEYPSISREKKYRFTIDWYLNNIIPNEDEEFVGPRPLLRCQSVHDAHVKAVKKIVRRKSVSVGYEFTDELDE